MDPAMICTFRFFREAFKCIINMGILAGLRCGKNFKKCSIPGSIEASQVPTRISKGPKTAKILNRYLRKTFECIRYIKNLIGT